MNVAIKKISFIFLYFIISNSYSQTSEILIRKEADKIDSSVVVYKIINSELIEIDRLYSGGIVFDDITYWYDKDSSIVYFVCRTLLSTCSTSGNNENQFYFNAYKILPGLEKLTIKEFKVLSNQHYGTFREVYIQGENLLYIYNNKEVKRIPLRQMNAFDLRAFLE